MSGVHSAVKICPRSGETWVGGEAGFVCVHAHVVRGVGRRGKESRTGKNS